MISLAQEAALTDSGFSVGTTLAVTLNGVQAGSTLVALYTNDTTAGSTASAADNLNTGSYTTLETVNDTGNGQKTGMLYMPNSVAGNITMTVTWSAGEFTKGVWLAELRGALQSISVLAGHNSQLQNTPGTSTDGLTSGTATPSGQPALVFGLSFHELGAAPSAGSGFTSGTVAWNSGQFAGLGARSESKRITSTSAVAATFTAGANNSHVTLMGIFLEELLPTIDVLLPPNFIENLLD